MPEIFLDEISLLLDVLAEAAAADLLPSSLLPLVWRLSSAWTETISMVSTLNPLAPPSQSERNFCLSKNYQLCQGLGIRVMMDIIKVEGMAHGESTVREGVCP